MCLDLTVQPPSSRFEPAQRIGRITETRWDTESIDHWGSVLSCNHIDYDSLCVPDSIVDPPILLLSAFPWGHGLHHWDNFLDANKPVLAGWEARLLPGPHQHIILNLL